MTTNKAQTAFHQAAGRAIAVSQVTADQVNALIAEVNGDGWPAAMVKLENLIRDQALPVQYKRGRIKLFKV